MLRLNNIKKDYKVGGSSVHALRGVSLNFRTSEFVSILGPSGCGKTTLLNIIGGLDKYTSGDLIINGKSTKGFCDPDWDVYRNHRVGFVFQSYNLIPQQTVLGNVELALTIAGLSRDERRTKAAAALEKVGLKDQINKYPNQLSGGQCQRVAIARALVNDPEILLADEPTGALDSKTSVQVMELIKEIAKERLVIMVTHNPELAVKYSTRIIKLLDGKVVADSHPYSVNAELDEELSSSIKELDKRISDGQLKGGRKEKAKMGFGTAFMLSLRNLLTKKKRTFMTVFAGSIGIIGVAVVLAFSSGITGYISDMENDMLSGYPVSVTSSSIDFSAIMNMTNLMNESDDEVRLADKIYVNQIVETLTKLGSITVKNDITEEYIDYIKELPEKHPNAARAIRYNYGISYANNIYTEYSYDEEGADKAVMSITGIRNVFGSVLENIDEYRMYASMINSIAAFSELPDNEDYIMSQYDLVAGEYPVQGDKNSLVLVLSNESKVDDLLLAQMGYVSQREFMNYSYLLAQEGGNEYYQKNVPHMDGIYDYTDFVGDDSKTFTWYPNSSVYVPNGDVTAFEYQTYKTSSFTGGVDLNVACILKPQSTVQYGSLSSGMYFTKALTDYILDIETNPATQSEIVKKAWQNAQGNDPDVEPDMTRANVNNVTFSYRYYTDADGYKTIYNGNLDLIQSKDKDNIITANERNIKITVSNKGFGSNSSSGSGGSSSGGLEDISQIIEKDRFKDTVKQMLPGDDAAKLDALLDMMIAVLYETSDRVVTLSMLGGNTLPTGIYFYVDNFDNKEVLTAYLDEWNVGKEETEKITYTDTIGVIMTMVNMLVMIISIALIAFTSLSLVVSTVMIAIITYVSVVERIKEIGVIRALGGRKKDVSNLFVAETFMLGLGSGIIGIVITYIIQLLVNLTLGAFVGVPTIANLLWWSALIMIGISVGLTLISGLMPAKSAAKKDPVTALRTE